MDVLLAPGLGWDEHPEDEGFEPPDELIPDGQAMLLEALKPDPEFGLRTNTGVALWVTALLAGCLAQWGPSGVKLSTDWFILSSVVELAAFAVAAIAYPRASPRVFPVVEQAMILLAFAIGSGQIAETGGAGSPYGAWLLFPVFYVAYFMPPRRVALNVGLATAIALAPFLYDPDPIDSDNFVSIMLLVVVIWVMAATLLFRRQMIHSIERAVNHQALGDPLTGVANLRGFERFAGGMTDAGESFALAMVDMNGMRGANTVFGYEIGDAMIVRMAALMLQACGPDDQVARIGGDEFAVLLPGAGENEAAAWRGRLEAALAAHNERARGRSPRISAAVGTSVFPVDGRTVDELLAVADASVYEQKTPAVEPPYEVTGGLSLDAPRMLHNPARLEIDGEAFGPREYATQAAVLWLLVASLIFTWLLLPGVEVPRRHSVAAVGAFCLAISAICVYGRIRGHEAIIRHISDVSTMAMIAPGLWITGGWKSPLQMAGVLVVAFYAQFFRGLAAIARIAAVILLYALAFWTSGAVSAAGESLFAATVTVEIVIGAILLLNARATTDALAVVLVSASRDPLTGLPNLFAIRSDLEARLERAAANDELHLHRPLLVIADIDDFRQFNTLGGHGGGDAILLEAARRLVHSCGKDCKAYRIGGDEFAVLGTVDGLSRADAIAERTRRALTFTPPERLGIRRPIVATVGYSLWSDEMSSEALVAAVESALEENKKSDDQGPSGGKSVML